MNSGSVLKSDFLFTHMFPLVKPQRRCLSESLIARQTPENLLLIVVLLVKPQCARLSESLLARETLEPLFSTALVLLLVTLQSGCLGESFATGQTLERPLSSVHSQVLFQGPLLYERLSTFVTSEWLLPLVKLHVSVQTNRI